ncbi:Rieske (2Fe-2S) protein [Paeniglutamicibacter psychrophenolicus]|uniref:Rieske (2Fe-2S) protein n=1 Tax=Paeniglutamicibacter psychrophenolicus TaxID=257454 RepID=UPI002788AA77|nr:Rieske (2Fe-2S) protein [Paeniglutamicibacter psychrophenolicus]MDQ0096003.1 nitrite reductase/ring-hydroxylating ferredoxin subunit/uncharacterized membrane protein [Paeniglutamicibacter psychrophenolicus]
MKTLKPFKAVELLERLESLDAMVAPVQRVVRRVLGTSDAADLLHGVPLGHPAHPFLVQLPTGALGAAVLLDAVPGAERAARTLLAAGLLAMPPAIATGLADWAEGHPQHLRVGLVHAGGNVVAAGCFAYSLTARISGRSGGRVSALAGLAVLGAAGFLGGHLSFRLASGANHVEAVPHLVPAGWSHLGLLQEIPERQLHRRMLGRVPLLLWREGDEISAISNECPHLSGPLHEGTVTGTEADTCVRCPWHGSEFSLSTGQVVRGPATAPAASFAVWVKDERVQVYLPGAG